MGKVERRLDLLRAARDVFATKGFHDAKVDDIVAAANVAKGTFYLYFQDKRSIFAELVDGLFARLGGAILHVDAAGDIEAQVKHNIRAIVAVLLDEPKLTRILLSYAPALDPEFGAKIQSFYAGVKALLQESLSEGQDLGIVAPGDASLYATFTLGALKEILFENVTGVTNRPREQIVSDVFLLLQRGYLRIDAQTSPGKLGRGASNGVPSTGLSVARRSTRSAAAVEVDEPPELEPASSASASGHGGIVSSSCSKGGSGPGE